MKYIEHYFHYRADESPEILGKGRKIKPAEEFEMDSVNLGSQSDLKR